MEFRNYAPKELAKGPLAKGLGGLRVLKIAFFADYLGVLKEFWKSDGSIAAFENSSVICFFQHQFFMHSDDISWSERIYNSHYGNGVPAMFIS